MGEAAARAGETEDWGELAVTECRRPCPRGSPVAVGFAATAPAKLTPPVEKLPIPPCPPNDPIDPPCGCCDERRR